MSIMHWTTLRETMYELVVNYESLTGEIVKK